MELWEFEIYAEGRIEYRKYKEKQNVINGYLAGVLSRDSKKKPELEPMLTSIDKAYAKKSPADDVVDVEKSLEIMEAIERLERGG